MSIYDMAINIIIDDADTQNPIFVEIETDDGQSISVGESLTTTEGLRKIRISVSDIIQHKKT